MMTDTTGTQPHRILHTMLRVRDLEMSVDFNVNTLGMREWRRQNFPEGQFSLSSLGYGEEEEHTILELTQNWGDHSYDLGNAWGHVALEVDNLDATDERLRGMGVPVLREPGPMSFATDKGERDVIAFIADPDGYQIELIER